MQFLSEFPPLSAVSSHAFDPETEALKALLPEAAHFSAHMPAILASAERLIAASRQARQPVFSIEGFLQEYGLDTAEGVNILSLAEALLRIPDKATMDALIRHSFSGTGWEQHLGKSNSFAINSASLGLALTNRLVGFFSKDHTISNLLAKAGDPLIRTSLRKAIGFIGSAFVMGETIEEALKQSKTYRKRGYTLSFDMLGEGARSEEQAESYFQGYMQAIETLATKQSKEAGLFARDSISVKLSALDPRYELLHSDKVRNRLLPRLVALAEKAVDSGISLTIDAEEASRLDLSLMVFSELIGTSGIRAKEGIGLAVQAYQKRAPYVLDYLAELANTHSMRIPVRLVKGAYWDAEIKKAQVLGLKSYPVYTKKEHTDIAYLACAHKLLGRKKQFYSQFATHNALTIASILSLSPEAGSFEFQRLHGMGESLYDALLKDEAIPCRIYAPVGSHENLLAYLIRRLLENGASNSFVHKAANKDVPLSALLGDPLTTAKAEKFHPAAHIPLPSALYGEERTNSRGFDLGNYRQLTALTEALVPFTDTLWEAYPLINGKAYKSAETAALPANEPGNSAKQIGKVTVADIALANEALKAAEKGVSLWAQSSPQRRAVCLKRLAELYETHMPELLALCMREGGKTLADSMAEVREAIDFCRYYAEEATRLFGEAIPLPGPSGEQNRLKFGARGVFLCISPWNFPLAIFTGQIAAALAAGNSVIAKPAEQTPLIAMKVVSLMLEAGIPPEALHFLPGEGGTLGPVLTSSPIIAGVAFTGSTETAQTINRSLAARKGPIVPFIAETGGQNALIVDSSSLIEQAMDDIIASAFGSIGQRCSALRVLFVQEEIADRLEKLLAGAMAEITIDMPWNIHADLGPVIDQEALKQLEAHIETMTATQRLIARTPLPSNLHSGHYLAPHAFAIPSIDVLEREIFGPVLHVIRYTSDELPQVVEAINRTGYGLTLGIYSRIQERISYVEKHARVGNLYVNRSIIGAVVGVQPFGGEGLSGTGPKAGGPHYLLRFATERTVTVNTAAIGGNIGLLAHKEG